MTEPYPRPYTIQEVTRKAMTASLYENVSRKSPLLDRLTEDWQGRLHFRRVPWWRPPLYRLRRRLRGVWWALIDKLPDEENWTEWL